MLHYKRLLLVFAFFSIALSLFADDCFQLKRSSGDSAKVLKKDVHFNCSTSFTVHDDNVPINGLSIFGSIRKESPDYFVRILLTDGDQNEYVILESYEELNDNYSFSFDNFAEETLLLDNIVPDSIKVFLKDASVSIDSVAVVYSTRGLDNISERRVELKKRQIGDKVERINKYNLDNGRPWIADVTELSQLPYSQKKRALGLSNEFSLNGIEYYAGGYFVVGHGAVNLTRELGNDPYVDSFDWRNRHGKNWNSAVKHQDYTNYCTAFATLACSESLIKLYYNNPSLEIDLSEQEIASCSDVSPHYMWQGVTFDQAFDYIHEHGVCDEESYPLHLNPSDTIYCESGNFTPNEWFQMGSDEFAGSYLRDIKSALISKGPLVSGWSNSNDPGHAMALVGYGKLHVGDSVWKYNPNNNVVNKIHTVTQQYDGSTYWIFKNSYGVSTGDQGYYYLIFDSMIGTNSNVPISNMIPAFSIGLPIASLNYTDDNIIVEDADGDGYYNWGLGNKPAGCPSWIPDDLDSDDSDSTKYRMDQYGHLYDVMQRDPYTLTSDCNNYSTNLLMGGNITIPNGRTYTLYGSMIGIGSASITIKSGGKLIIDGGIWANAKLYLSPGSELIIRNGGKIYMSSSKNFYAPIGCKVIVENGEINGSYKIKSAIWQ